MWPYSWTHVGTASHPGHMDRVAATMPSQAHAGAAQEAPDIGQWEGQDLPLVRPSSCIVKGGIPSSQRYLPTYLYRQPGMVERRCGWILVPLHMRQPLHVAANTVHNISFAIENDVLPQHHHIEQPLRNKYCRVVFHEKVSVDDPHRVLQIQETG